MSQLLTSADTPAAAAAARVGPDEFIELFCRTTAYNTTDTLDVGTGRRRRRVSFA